MSLSRADKKWGRLNEKVIEAAGQGDWFGAGIYYYEMAKQLRSEGKEDSKFRKLGYEMKLRHAQNYLRGLQNSEVIKKVELMATNDSCTACKEKEGKIYTISSALESNPLPVKECDQEKGYGCRCVYLPVNEW